MEEVNLRDVSEAAPDRLRSKIVYRSSEVVGPEKLSKLGIKSIVDLRETKHSSIKDDQDAKGRQRVFGFISKVSRTALTWATQRANAEAEPCKRCSRRIHDESGEQIKVYHAGIMQPRAKGAVFWLMPARVKLKAIGGMLKGRGPKAVVQPAVANPEEMGYSGLYAAILSHGKSRVAIALRILMVEENFPVVIHCTHGKDRTGVIIMLLLLLCNVSTEAIEEDYARSEGNLNHAKDKPDPDMQLENSFMKASNITKSSPKTMSKTIQHLVDQYGSPENYIREIGISDEEIGVLSEEQYQSAMALRALAGDAGNKHLIREAGGIEALLRLLDSGPDSILTVVGAETLSCLAADDPANRDMIREFGGIQSLVNLLAAGPEAECTHRALLALRILTDKETDRLAILKAGGIAQLVSLLAAGPDSEVTEYAAAALGNLAAGSQQIKDAIRQSGGIKPLVRLLRDDPDEISAELAAVVLRNLALQNAVNRAAIKDAGGLQPLLRLLSMGQEKLVYPLTCEVVYNDIASGQAHRGSAGQCCFDPHRGHLCVALKPSGGPFACFGGSKHQSPRDKHAERYSLLRKLTITEPSPNVLELNFTVADKEGAPRIAEQQNLGSGKTKQRRLERIAISPCSATEIKGAIMRMLTRMHLEREFKLSVPNGAGKQNLVSTPSASGQSMAHFPMEADLERHALQPIQPSAA